LGIVAIIFFLAIFLNYGRKAVFYKKEDTRLPAGQAPAVVSFLGAAYLWTFVVLYSPGLLIFAMAFIMTGVFLASLVNSGKIGAAEISLSGPLRQSSSEARKTKSEMVFMIMGIILLIGTISSGYLYSRKFLALNNYSRALVLFEKSGDIDATGKKLTKAVGMDKQDEYYRALSELGIISLSKIVANKDLPADKALALFKDNLGITIAYAREAVRLNPADPINWMQLGRVYESVVALKVEKADEAALNSYAEAFKASPLDPSPFIASARVFMQINKAGEAKKYLQSALNIKPDFADALFMLAQIEAQAGNLKEAILRMEQTAAVSPNNFGVFFQLGLLQYQNNNLSAARSAFERTVGLNGDYANARYFLGLIYDRQGLKEKAVEQFVQIQKTNPNNEEVKKILSNLKNAGKAIVLCPQRHSEVWKLADRVVVLKAGEKITEGTPEEVRNHLGGRALLALTVKTEHAAQAAALLQENGIRAEQNGSQILIEVPLDKKTLPFALLHEASISVLDYELESDATLPEAL